jgi:hypothetical protein
MLSTVHKAGGLGFPRPAAVLSVDDWAAALF